MHWLLWLGLPLGFIGAAIAIREFVSQDAFVWFINDELGPGENLTAVLAILSGGLALWLAFAPGVRAVLWLRAAFFVLAAVMIFLAGEEFSYGQHFFGWGTPDWIAEVNIQQETNLHNIMPRSLDQLPRAIVSILIFVGGVVVPLLDRYGRLRRLERSRVLYWLVPETTLIPVALLVIAPRVFDRIQVWFQVTLPSPFDIHTRYHQEMQETLIATTIFLYLLALVLKVRRGSRAT